MLQRRFKWSAKDFFAEDAETIREFQSMFGTTFGFLGSVFGKLAICVTAVLSFILIILDVISIIVCPIVAVAQTITHGFNPAAHFLTLAFLGSLIMLFVLRRINRATTTRFCNILNGLG